MWHIQKTVPNWLDSVYALPDGALVKSVDNGQIFREVKGINSNIYTLLRHHVDGQQFGGSWEENVNRARAFFQTFIDGTFEADIAPYCDFVSEWNEYLAASHTMAEIAVRVMWAEACAWVWKHEYRTKPQYQHIRLVLLDAPVGNIGPQHKEFAEIAIQYDCLLGEHPYTLWMQVGDEYLRAANDWVDLSGRWNTAEKTWGLKPDWIFTEAGPFASVVDGWRSGVCLNGSIERYVNAVQEWIQDIQTTAAYKEGRLYGFALFTTNNNADNNWKYYETGMNDGEMMALAQMIAAEWKPGTAPTPPPPEPEPECRGKPRIQYNRIVWVLPGTETTKQRRRVIDMAAVNKRSITWSYDDAGIGDLDQRTAVLFGLATEQQDTYIKWYAANYPGVVVRFRDLPIVDPVPEPAYSIIDIVNDLPKHATKTYKTRHIEDITTLVIHHTVSPPDRPISSIAAYHVDSRGWPGIGYHFVITDTGKIYMTNFPETISYHAGVSGYDNNEISLGIALQGDFTNAPPPQAQQDAARWLVQYLRKYLDRELTVKGHREMPGAQTACPGATYKEWLAYVSQ